MKIRQLLAKARTRVSAYDKVGPFNLGEAIIHREKQLDHDGRYHRPDYGNTIPWKRRTASIPGIPVL